MRFPLRQGARQGESKAGKETVRAQTSVPQAQTSACAGQNAFLFLFTMFFFLIVLHCSNAKLLYCLSQMYL